MKYTFSIILPTYNNLDELKTCLKSLEKLSNTDFEVIVSVDGSTDGTIEFLNECQFRYPCNSVISLINNGRSAARNKGISIAKGTFLLLLDADMEVDMHLLDNHLEVLHNGELIVSQGFVVYPQNDDFGQYAMRRGKGKYPQGALLEKKYLNTGNVALPTFMAKQILFDEKSPYGEDIIWSFDMGEVFDFKLINNRKAISYSATNVSVLKACERYFSLGKDFMPYMLLKFPDSKSVFKIENYSKISYKLVSIQLIYTLVRTSYQYFPQTIRLILIHYMLFFHLKRGLTFVGLVK